PSSTLSYYTKKTHLSMLGFQEGHALINLSVKYRHALVQLLLAIPLSLKNIKSKADDQMEPVQKSVLPVFVKLLPKMQHTQDRQYRAFVLNKVPLQIVLHSAYIRLDILSFLLYLLFYPFFFFLLL